MKKFLFLLFLFLILFSFNVYAADIAYVLKNPSLPNNNFIGVLNELNLSYDLIDDSDIASTNFSNYRMILLDDENIDNVPVNSYKSLFVNPDYYSGWSQSIGSTASNQPLRANNIINNPITEGIEGEFQVYTSCCDNSGINLKMYYLRGRKYSTTKITSTLGSTSEYVVATKENPRRVFFGITETDFWTSISRQLFKQAITWVLRGEDRDGDGFYDDDCNDNNPEIWQNLKGYLDNDEDGYGTGNLLDVCSGEELSEGYSEISGDCNDSNANINPDAEEIPYDSLDNDCSGGDLADVDEDGYCLINYNIQNKNLQCNLETGLKGTDCDDSDEEINPDALEILDDIDQNCRNDLPIFIGNIPNLIWNEDQDYPNAIDLNEYFDDYEGDALDFDIHDTSDDRNITVYFDNGLISFISEENWFGEDWVIFKASDEEGYAISNLVNLEVTSVNDAPVLQEIEDIYAAESQLVEIEAIASDIDDSPEELAYSINDTRFIQDEEQENVFRWQTEIEDSGVYVVQVSVSDGLLSDNKDVTINIISKIVINEFLSNPSEGNDWLEIYNSNEVDINLDDCYLEDEALNVKNLEGILGSGEFAVFEWSNRLNNGGDTIKLYCFDVLVDDVTYGTALENAPVPNEDESVGRIPDGKDTNIDNEDFFVYDIPTPNLPYDIPYLLGEIPEQTWNEDEILEINLEEHFEIRNPASVIYSSTSPETIDVSISEGTARLIPEQDWFGLSSVVFSLCQLGYCVESNSVNLRVTSVNDAPVLQEIENIIVNENELVTIRANAVDVDSTILAFEINDSRFSQQGNVFTWQTDYNSSGVYVVEISVSDDLLKDSQEVTITVNDLNEPPYLSSIDDITIDEDSGFTDNFALNAIDNDGFIASYEVINENVNQVNCQVSDAVFGVSPKENWYGTAFCTIQVKDDDNAVDSKQVKIIVNAINDKPEITSFSPEYNPKIPEDSSQEFSVSWEDIDNTEAEVIVRWYVDSEMKGIGDNYIFVGEGIEKDYEIKVEVSDGFLIDEKEWNLKTSLLPITEKYDGETTDFSSLLNLECVDLILEKTEKGKIEFLDCVDLRDVVDIDRFSEIFSGLAGIDSEVFPEFKNRKAKLSFFGLSFEKTPAIYYDSGFDINSETQNVCPSSICSNISYADGILEFNANSFSTFIAGNTLACSQQKGFICSNNEVCRGEFIDARDSDRCCSQQCIPAFSDIESCELIDENISIEIKDPENNDEFEPGDIIEGEINIANKKDEKKEFEAEVFLYDLDEEDKIESWKKDVKVGKKDEKKLDFELKIPEDALEKNKHYVYAKIIDEDNEDSCNDNFIELKIEREKDRVVIEDLEIDKEKAKCNDFINFYLKLKNIGSDEQDVHVEIENSELGILEKSEEFELEEFDEDDEKELNFNIKVPENYEKGDTEFKVRVIYEDEEIEKVNVELEECVKKFVEVKEVKEISLGERVKETIERVIRFDDRTKMLFISLSLLVGIFFLIMLIIIVASRIGK